MLYKRHSLGAFTAVLLALLAGCVGGDVGVTGQGGGEIPGQGGVERPDDGRELGAHISGVIIDTELIPVAEVEVVITPGDHIVLTDMAGVFVVGPLEPGTYTVIAQKRGYASKEQQVSVTASDETKVRLTLQPIASDVPHHETYTEAMYLICHIVSPASPVGQLNAPCAGLLDIAVGATNTLDHWIFFFTIDKPGFQSLVSEMVWEPQPTGHDGLMQLSTEGRAAAGTTGVTVAGSVYGDTQGPPFHAVLHAGQNYWNPEDPATTFYPEPNATETFKMLIAGGGGNTTTGGAFFLEFRPTAYLTFFYNRQAAPDFSILPPD